MKQLKADNQDFIYQQDGAPPHFHHGVREYLDDKVPRRWIGRASRDDSHLLPWPPRLPHLTLANFFLWGYVIDHGFVSPFPRHLAQLRERIMHIITDIDCQKLGCVWR